MTRIIPILVLLILTIISCNKSSEKDSTENKDSVATVEPQIPQLTKVWETDTVLTTNESVLYDPEKRILYVSNISGEPSGKDGVGFISKLNADGSVELLDWVSGLNAPKGMAILNDKLYVTDIDELVEIDLNDSSVINRYPVENASFLNDVATDGEKVYFSDMGTGNIHIFENGTLSLYADSVKNINGLALGRHGEIYGLDNEGLIKYTMEDSEPEIINAVVTDGDGLIIIDDSTYIASRWQGEIYLVKNGKEYLMLDTKDQNSNTADIGYIPEEQLVLVPTFLGNKVVAYKLSY